MVIGLGMGSRFGALKLKSLTEISGARSKSLVSMMTLPSTWVMPDVYLLSDLVETRSRFSGVSVAPGTLSA